MDLMNKNDFRQTSGKLRTYFGQTSDFGPRTDFGFWTLHFGFALQFETSDLDLGQTSDLGLWTDFGHRTSDYRLRTDFRLQILDF